MGQRPAGVVCPICGREYFSASIGIHIKQCEKLWTERESRKPKHERRVCPSVAVCPQAVSLPLSSRARQEWNERAFATFNDAALVPCGNCGRTFTPEALERHQKACTPARPLCRKAAGGRAARRAPGAQPGPRARPRPEAGRSIAVTSGPNTEAGRPGEAPVPGDLRRTVEENRREIRELTALVRRQQEQIDALMAGNGAGGGVR